MKISIIGAGNVGGLTAMRLVEAGFGDIVLADITKGLAQGKAFDLSTGSILKFNYRIQGTDDIENTKNSDIISYIWVYCKPGPGKIYEKKMRRY